MHLFERFHSMMFRIENMDPYAFMWKGCTVHGSSKRNYQRDFLFNKFQLIGHILQNISQDTNIVTNLVCQIIPASVPGVHLVPI